MGFLNDVVKGASAPGVINNGMNIGVTAMAELQRQKELRDADQVRAEQQAFMNMMNQQKFDAEQQQAAQGQQNWQQTFDLGKYNIQQQGVNALSDDMNTYTNNLRDNVRADRVADAQIGNYKEGRAPSEAEFFWNQMTPEQQQEAVGNYVQDKFKASGGSGGGSTLTPSNMLSLRGQMMNPITGGNPQTPMSDVTNMAGQIQRTTDSLNTANAGAPMPMQQTAKPQHPAIQKMLQDGITMQMILQDFAQNQQEYEAQGITLEMLQGQ